MKLAFDCPSGFRGDLRKRLTDDILMRDRWILKHLGYTISSTFEPELNFTKTQKMAHKKLGILLYPLKPPRQQKLHL